MSRRLTRRRVRCSCGRTAPDVHCHVFNVDDLPVYEFARYVALPDRCLEELDGLAFLVAQFMYLLAPGLETEGRALRVAAGPTLAGSIVHPAAADARLHLDDAR